MTRPTFINCDRLELKPPEEGDIRFLREGVNHPQVRRFISSFRTPYTNDRYRDELWPIDNDGDSVTLLAVPSEGEFVGEPVGSLSLSPIIKGDGYANFGIWFHPKAWGNGYALESSAYLIEYGFEYLRLHRISATVMAPNEASKTLCERLGFVHEGTAREAQFAGGEYVDVDRYGLLHDEWRGPNEILSH
ncbi:GNAT family N-acetyltransferase [Natronorubrum daqingense]|uniref:GNAT family N-acetyltransferase n=1 Tax=Natronorubrum daqingense TaxID=588898 RepID=A0A1N6ZHE3_9EURY|nr:GNAT family protein [Natronorubrum daqingense]APX95348.1 GNAT family N-acetyltransferase [Natronorubrum daqingense]SIR26322.1 Protein N-acetyltransferase, RimJ/RimL family [Natronorubrum daqingense]